MSKRRAIKRTELEYVAREMRRALDGPLDTSAVAPDDIRGVAFYRLGVLTH